MIIYYELLLEFILHTLRAENTTLVDEHINGDVDYLLEAANRRLCNLNKWWPRLYSWNCLLTGTSVVLSGIAPFGLGLLLYIPQHHAKELNIILIVLTAIAFIAQVWNVTQKNKERALHLRLAASELESAIVSYQCGLIDPKAFALAFREISVRDAEEPSP